MAASIYDKLSALCEEIEIDILAKEGSEKAQRDALGELKDRAYLDRSPEAEHATQLYRRFRDVAADKGGSGAGGAPLDGTIAGAAHYLSQKPRPLYYVNEVTEGTSEALVGFAATDTHIFRLRAAIALQMLLGFLFIACNHYVAQGHDLTAHYMLSTLCPAKASAITGTFDMRLFQFNAALAFFMFFLNFCFCVYYVLPVDETGRKYIPGFRRSVERALGALDNERASHHTLNFMDRVSVFCHGNAKQLEMYADATLLVVTLFFLVIGSIEIDRGAAFMMTSDNSSVWYTVGTFYMTYKDCFEKSDAAANIRFAYACMYLGCFTSLMSVKYAYDSFQKYKLKYMSSDGEGGMDHPMGRGSAHDGRSLMANQDEHDDVVQVDL